jgi:hypothetical protein
MKQIFVLGVCGVAIALLVVVGCSGKGSSDDTCEANGDCNVTIGECANDDSSMPDNGQFDPDWKLVADSPSALNYICPAKDVDYFWFETTADGTILSVTLLNTVSNSPINLCYSIIPNSDHNQTLDPPKCRGATIGQIDIQATHYIEKSGIYFIKVWADNNKEDRKNAYVIKISQVTDPDQYEKNGANNDKGHAKSVVANQKGYISYLGDQDWFKIDGATAGQMLSITLDTDGGSELNLYYEVWSNDTRLYSNVTYDPNESLNTIDPINIEDMLALPVSGTYYVMITDKEGDTSSTTVGYTVTLTLEENPDNYDKNQPFNNSPTNATSFPVNGGTIPNVFIASRGDQDWYKISSSQVVTIDEPKLLAIELSGLPATSQVVPAVDLFVADQKTSCSSNSDCDVLTTLCDERECFNGECVVVVENNINVNHCRGGGVCLPSGKCAINQLVMLGSLVEKNSWSESQNDIKHLKTVAPMYGSEYYILVESYKGQNYDQSHSYTIKVNVIDEPDRVNEINSLYLPYADNDEDESLRKLSSDIATNVDCVLQTGSNPVKYICTITGYLSFRGDQDWYKLNNITRIQEDAPNTTQWKDWNLKITCTNNSPDTNVNFEIFSGGELIIPRRSDFQNGQGTVVIGGDIADKCSYLCGEYYFSDYDTTTYLRVQHSNRRKYDYAHSYTLTIEATLECPRNCGHCNPSCQDHPCPSPQTGGTGGCVPW